MTGLRALVAAELAVPVDPRVSAMAAAIAAQHGDSARAVLFYGSCLREAVLDGLMLDFYLIVSDYPSAYDKRWLARANAAIPPNVFPFSFQALAAKYAVLSEDDFARLCAVDADNVSVWARFAQPTRLVWSAGEAASVRAIDAVCQAPLTVARLTRPLLNSADRADPLALWRRCFTMTYGAELRAESAARPGSIVDSDPARYRAFGAAALETIATESDRVGVDATWRRLQRRGKWLSVIRLAKASFTFAGGIDYLAWKINRHAGTQIVIRPWQRRWPLLAAFTLLPKLLARGAVR